MISKSEFKELINKIVIDYFQDELEAYEIFGEDQINKTFLGEELLEETDNEIESGSFEAGLSIIEIMKFIATILGTFKTSVDLYKMFKKKPDLKSRQIIDSWKKELIEVGLDEDVATGIANKFHQELKSKIIASL